MREAVASLQPRIIRESELERFGRPQTLLFNVNDPADLAAAERMLAPAGATARSRGADTLAGDP
jgi:hypothetical protein